MEQTLLSKKQLAERWGVCTATIDRRVKDKLISPTMVNPIRFNLEDILKAEGTDYSKMSPFERRRLEREKEELEQKVQELEEENRIIKSKITNSVADLSQILKEV